MTFDERAAVLAPPLRPKYRVAIEKRTYLNYGDSVEVGIPDVVVISQKSTTVQNSSIATLKAQSEFVTVTIPVPEEVREGQPLLLRRRCANGFVKSHSFKSQK